MMTHAIQNNRTVEETLAFLGYKPDSEAKLNEARDALNAYTLSGVQLNYVRAILNNWEIANKSVVKAWWFLRGSETNISQLKLILKHGDFQLLIQAFSENALTAEQFSAFCSCALVLDSLVNTTSNVERTGFMSYCETIERAVEFKELNEKLSFFSQYNISQSDVAMLNKAFLAEGKSDLETIKAYLHNLDKYGQPTQPWGVWFKEMLGLAADESEGANTVEVKQDELHTDAQITETAEHLA